MTTVLLVDDEHAIVDALTGILEDEGYRVLSAPDGRQALDALAAEQVDVVVMDVMMPVMNGRELLAALRASPRLAPVPVVVTSAVPLHVLQRTGAPALTGHQVFLQKPFDLGELLGHLQALSRGAAPAGGGGAEGGG